jgi:hypothetical protein
VLLVKRQSRMWRRQHTAPNPGQGLMVIWAWRRALFAFRRTRCEAVHLIDQLDRGLNAVLQAFALRASYVDLGITPTKLEPCATAPAHHWAHFAPSVPSAIHMSIILPVFPSFVVVPPVMHAIPNSVRRPIGVFIVMLCKTGD